MAEKQEKPLTINALASRYSLDRRTLKKYLHGIEPVKVSGPHKLYDLHSVEQAIEAAKNKPSTPKMALECAVLEERLKALRRQNEIEAGKLIELAAVQRWVRETSLGQKFCLQAVLERELPPKLVGLGVIEIMEHMKGVVDRICLMMQHDVFSPDLPPAGFPIEEDLPAGSRTTEAAQ